MVFVQTVAKALTALLLVLAGSVSSGLASHAETDDTGWYERQYNNDDTRVIYCTALGVLELGGGWYLHDRPGPDSPYGTGLISDGGGGTYILKETNGIPGIQIPRYYPWGESECPNPDSTAECYLTPRYVSEVLGSLYLHPWCRDEASLVEEYPPLP